MWKYAVKDYKLLKQWQDAWERNIICFSKQHFQVTLYFFF